MVGVKLRAAAFMSATLLPLQPVYRPRCGMTPRRPRRSARHFTSSTHRPPRRSATLLPVMASSSNDYQPSDDDKVDTSADIPTELTLSQQLLMKQYEEQVDHMSERECKDLAVEIVRQMMVKDNLMKGMIKAEMVRFDPPNPDDITSDVGDGD